MKMRPLALVFAGGLLAAPAFADNPREFLQEALKGDNSEIMLGSLAQQKGDSRDVKRYGRILVSDHTKARAEVLSVGRQFGLRGDRRVADEARDEREKLSHMRRPEFDREFVHYMAEDHQKDVNAFRDEAHERHGRVSRLAETQLPVLEKHLRMAMAMDRRR
ncbi:MAG: DUF4142 domain-containing protein [Alphaproteobacteria bacterium]|nr:DUF4142 domain-containing protein [Alphaproteobacteria bacterium]